jgi:lysophospholipase L1-like esterase
MKVIKEILFSIIGISVITLLLLWGLGFFKGDKTPSQIADKLTPTTEKKIKNLKILALGDSLTQGVGDTKNQSGYQKRLTKKIAKTKQVQKATIYDEGVSGERSDQILKRFKTSSKIQKEATKSDVLIVTAGGNDLFQNLQKDVTDSPSQIAVNVNRISISYQENLQKIFSYARKLNPKIKIVMVGVYNPFYVYFPNVTAITQAIETFNTTAEATGDYFKHSTFVDVNALSVGQYKTASQQRRLKKQSTEDDIAVVEKSQLESSKFDTKEKNNYLSDADHFHPNNKGYDMMADKIFNAMNKAGIFK